MDQINVDGRRHHYRQKETEVQFHKRLIRKHGGYVNVLSIVVHHPDSAKALLQCPGSLQGVQLWYKFQPGRPLRPIGQLLESGQGAEIRSAPAYYSDQCWAGRQRRACPDSIQSTRWDHETKVKKCLKFWYDESLLIVTPYDKALLRHPRRIIIQWSP